MDHPRRERDLSHRVGRIEPRRASRLDLGKAPDADAAGCNDHAHRASRHRGEDKRSHRDEDGERNGHRCPAARSDTHRRRSGPGAAAERSALVRDLSRCLQGPVRLSKCHGSRSGDRQAPVSCARCDLRRCGFSRGRSDRAYDDGRRCCDGNGSVRPRLTDSPGRPAIDRRDWRRGTTASARTSRRSATSFSR